MPQDASYSRRRVLAGGAAGVLLPFGIPVWAREADSWAPAKTIVERIPPPRFLDREFDIRSYGADGRNQVKTSAAVRAAIATCTAAGGGRVVVPAGMWPTGPIHLRSNVDLHLKDGATLRFSTDSRDYLPLVLTRFEGVECMNYSPLIYAFGQSRIAITGRGTLEGGADWSNWWRWTSQCDPAIVAARDSARTRLAAMAERNVPVAKRIMGPGAYLRPNFIQLYRCNDILIDGPTIVDSPMWVVHPVLSSNVTVRRVTVRSPGPNNDGCDPESCRDVLIEHCEFETGDDCIAIKSGRNFDGRRINVPSENIVIRNCRMRKGHGGVSLGSEASGGIRNILISNCDMGGAGLERALRIKTNSYRGGYIEHVVFRDIRIESVLESVLQVSLLYGEGEGGPFLPRRVGDVLMDTIVSGSSRYGLDVRGSRDLPIESVRLRNCRFDNVREGNCIADATVSADHVIVNGRPWSPGPERIATAPPTRPAQCSTGAGTIEAKAHSGERNGSH